MKTKFSLRTLLNNWKIQRTRFFYWILRDVVKYPLKPLNIYLIMLRFIIMPINTLYWAWIKPQNDFYDIASNTYTIAGIKYSGVLFSTLAFGQLNKPFVIIKREDGIIIIGECDPYPPRIKFDKDILPNY